MGPRGLPGELPRGERRDQPALARRLHPHVPGARHPAAGSAYTGRDAAATVDHVRAPPGRPAQRSAARTRTRRERDDHRPLSRPDGRSFTRAASGCRAWRTPASDWCARRRCTYATAASCMPCSGWPTRRRCSGTRPRGRAGRAWRSRTCSQRPGRAGSSAGELLPHEPRRRDRPRPHLARRRGVGSGDQAQLAPTLERGFHTALADLTPRRALVVHPGADSYRLAPSIEAIGLARAVRAGASALAVTL